MTKDSNQRAVAGTILRTAEKTVCQDRGNSHGGAEDSFAMIGHLWENYLRDTMLSRGIDGKSSINNLDVTPTDVANMMVLLKIARSIYGDPHHADHYIDAAGYTSIAGSFNVKTHTPPMKAPVAPKDPPSMDDSFSNAAVAAAKRAFGDKSNG